MGWVHAHSTKLLSEDGRQLVDLALDGHVNVTRAILTILDDETAEEGFVNFRLELDVLGTRHLLQLLRDHELLLVFELDGRGHGGDLRVRGIAEEGFELIDDTFELALTLLVNQQVQEVRRERVETSLLADLTQDILLLFHLNGRVGQEAGDGRVRLDVRIEGFHVRVHLLERTGGLARVDERRGVPGGDRVGL